jgi:glycine hydroxymethyltransferase
MKEEHMQFIVNVIDTALTNADDEKALATISGQVKEFMHQFPLYPELG